MENAASENLNNLSDSEELKRFCTVFGVMQSNTIYRILSGNDKAGMIERVIEETENIKLNLRGSEKCENGQVWDEARGICV